MFDPPLGAPPSIEWVPVAGLKVDAFYQRSLVTGASASLIAAIAKAWDWRLCAPLVISRRDDGLYIIDGQHRHEAASRRGDIPHLPAIISRFDTLADEARCFVSLNTARKAMSALDTFKGALASGHRWALDVQSVIEDAGLRVAKHSNSSDWQAGEIACVGAVKVALLKHGRAITSAALVNLAEAFEGDVLVSAGRILAGLYLLHTSPDGIDPDLLIDVLKDADQEEWVRRMHGRIGLDGEVAPAAMCAVIRDAHDRAAGKSAA